MYVRTSDRVLHQKVQIPYHFASSTRVYIYVVQIFLMPHLDSLAGYTTCMCVRT